MAGATDDEVEDGWWTLLTVRRADGQVLGWPVAARTRVHLAWTGSGVLDRLPGRTGSTTITGLPPRSGLHVDVLARQVAWWTAVTAPGLAQEAPGRWPGWDVECWEDRYERQVDVCAGRVRVPAVDLARGFDRLDARLRAPRPDPVSPALETADLLRAEGRAVAVNPAVTAHVEAHPHEDERQHLVDALAAARRETAVPGGAATARERGPCRG